MQKWSLEKNKERYANSLTYFYVGNFFKMQYLYLHRFYIRRLALGNLPERQFNNLKNYLKDEDKKPFNRIAVFYGIYASATVSTCRRLQW
ncbi:hypothetical protein FLLO111716_11370 [Flavobacterium longum]